MDAKLRAQVEKVVRLALKQLEDAGQVQRWLDTPKVSLGGQTPLERMVSVQGCRDVTALLKEVNR